MDDEGARGVEEAAGAVDDGDGGAVAPIVAKTVRGRRDIDHNGRVSSNGQLRRRLC